MKRVTDINHFLDPDRYFNTLSSDSLKGEKYAGKPAVVLEIFKSLKLLLVAIEGLDRGEIAYINAPLSSVKVGDEVQLVRLKGSTWLVKKNLEKE